MSNLIITVVVFLYQPVYLDLFCSSSNFVKEWLVCGLHRQSSVRTLSFIVHFAEYEVVHVHLSSYKTYQSGFFLIHCLCYVQEREETD